MGQLNTAVIGGIIVGVIIILSVIIGVFALILQRRQNAQKSRVMVTMTGTTIRHKDGRKSVLEANWIPSLAGPGYAASYTNDSRRASTLSNISGDSPVENNDRSASPRNGVKRSSYMSAKRLEIPEALTEEEGPEYDNSSSGKGGSKSPSVDSGAVTPAEMQPPRIHIQDFDPSPIQSPEFERSFDIHKLLHNEKGISSDPLDENAAIHAV